MASNGGYASPVVAKMAKKWPLCQFATKVAMLGNVTPFHVINDVLIRVCGTRITLPVWQCYLARWQDLDRVNSNRPVWVRFSPFFEEFLRSPSDLAGDLRNSHVFRPFLGSKHCVRLPNHVADMLCRRKPGMDTATRNAILEPCRLDST